MKRLFSRLLLPLAIAAITALSATPAFAQTSPDVSVVVEFDNFVWYADDEGDVKKYATVREIIPVDIPKTWTSFRRVMIIADVIKVGGKPAAGTFFGSGVALNSATQPVPVAGRIIADAPRNQLITFSLEIMTPDKVGIGTLAGIYTGAGAPGPGVPRGIGIMSVTGGTGAFVGVRGQGTIVPALSRNINERLTTFREDPAFRRVNGGGLITGEFHLAGAALSEVMGAYHADFTPVTASSPAQNGELLTLEVKSGWPTRPYLAAGTVFALEPLQEVQVPVEVTMDGKPAEIVNKVGWPGTRDRYRVDVRIPSGTAPGTAAVVLNGGYLPGQPYKIPVR